MAAANEQIGIAVAAFYPTLSLTGSAGLESSSLAKWFTWPSRFWSVGPQLAETLFDAGRRHGVVAEQRAAYDATVAAYRETVLTAMQQVEDNLAALRILAAEADKVQQTVQAANSRPRHFHPRSTGPERQVICRLSPRRQRCSAPT